MRVEADWEKHCRVHLSHTLKEPEDNYISPRAILAKIKETFPDVDGAYVCINSALYADGIENIRKIGRHDFGMELFFKEDFTEQNGLSGSVLQQSALDFDIALCAGTFVGLSRSTFSNMVSFERAMSDCKTEDYIYNTIGKKVSVRTDMGRHISAASATRLVRI